MAEDKKPAPKQKPWKAVVAVAIIATIIAMIGAFTRKGKNSTPSPYAHAAPEMHTQIIGSERIEIKIPFGMRINFQPKTENVSWWVMIDRDEDRKHLRPPVNSPEYKSRDYGKDPRYVTFWAERGQAYTLSYYFVPASSR
ncbi:MAG: hypothetical protein KBC33_02160 [Candidatus Pacebacteria bacterium]|nr:hypothetical protein [Candidatus Paceibacterota bacterium]